jgi:hypothetical protein
MFKEVDVYSYFSTIQKSMEDKEKKIKLAIEDEKAKLATQKLLKEEAEAEAREKSKTKKKLEAEIKAKRKSEELRIKSEAEAEVKIPLLENPTQISISPPSTIVDDSRSISSVYSEQTFYYTIENMPEMEYVYNDPTFYIKYPNAYIFHLINSFPNNFHPTDLAIFHQISVLGTLHYAYTSIPDIPEYLPAKMFNFTSYNTHLHNINAMIYNRTYE